MSAHASPQRGQQSQATGHRLIGVRPVACSARRGMLVCLVMIALFCAPTTGRAQQISQYTQYVFNQFSVNPAVAGSKDCLDIRLGYRKQWSGFPGAPTTAWASVQGSIRPKGKPFVANRHGVGVWVEADDAGPYGYTDFYLAYAYHIQMAQDYFVSLGTFAGVKQMKFDAGEVAVADFDDPAVVGSQSSMVIPEITPGIWMYNKQGWMGLTLSQVLGNKVPKFGIGQTHLTRHYQFSAGRKFKVGKKTSLTPSTLMKLSPGSPLSLDLNVMLDFQKKIGIGVSYRNVDAFAAMFRVSFLKFFQVGYSYDITTSKVRVASSNTHEIILAITPCPPNDPRRAIVRCPVWE